VSLFDRRALVASWVRAKGGVVDPAIYTGQYRANAGASEQLTIKPDGKRGPFVAFGLARPNLSSAPPLSKLTLAVENERRISYNAVDRRALVHNDGASQFPGIFYSQWPAPVYVDAEASMQLSETCYDTSLNLQNLIYILAGFHTTPEMMSLIKDQWGELRTFSVDVAAVSSTNGGSAVIPFTIPEDDDGHTRVWLEEFCGVDAVAAGGGDLDFIRVTLMSSQLFVAQRQSGSLALALPSRMGIPTAYIGRYAGKGDNITVQERVPSTSRRDVWNFLCVAGGRPDVIENGGMLG
jgi:hypothetical protein